MQQLGEDNRPMRHNPGVFIDIDGVVLKGGKPFEWSIPAINALWENEVPFVFVTNGTYSSKTLLGQLNGIFNLPFTEDNIVVAPSPCKALLDFHNKRVLACCQDDNVDLVPELGFTDYLTVEELASIFPELDYVDHRKRDVLMVTPLTEDQKKKQAEFKPIEAIVLLGEPVNWECSLQLLLDVLMTNGDPRSKFKFVPSPHLPIIACNKDITFKGLANLPRFGHGAFLECLESLYMKVTNNQLVYEYMMGKPYLITYEYAANQLQRLNKKSERINKFYMIGDNPEVDIRGANIFKESLIGSLETRRPSIRSSRRPSMAEYLGFPHLGSQSSLIPSPNANKPVEAILVCTGVYNPQNDYLFHLRNLFQQTMYLGEEGSGKDDAELLTDACNTFSLTVPTTGARCSISTLPSSSSASTAVTAHKSPSSASVKSREEAQEAAELREALSRRNSFINYFENKLNMPDHTVANVLEAVTYILAARR